MQKQNFTVTLIIWVAAFIVAWFYNFQPDYEYSWYWMFFHGWLIIPSWIYSWFIDTKLCKPELYTTAYNVFWWLSVIGVSISVVSNIISFVLSFIMGHQEARKRGGYGE